VPPRVLFVSKPITPPYHDGTKCLVRDLSAHLSRYEAVVMSTRAGTGLPPGDRVTAAAVYGGAGAFTPAVLDNARAALWLVLASRADLWHFVFAPNARTSGVGRLARRLRQRPVVQTVASPPRVFDPAHLFGDALVVQSRWTRERVEAAARARGCVLPPVDVIPPLLGPLRPRTADEVARVRGALGLAAGAPVFVYPGDLELSSGAENVARAVEPICRSLPDAVVVFACRAKTPRAPEVQAALAARLPAARVRFAGGGYDLPALLLASDAVLFPVDDLYGKVDLPISLLEAMQLGVPVVAPDAGPLADLESVHRAPLGDPDALARAAVALTKDADLRRTVVEGQRREVEARYAAPRVARAYEAVYDRVLAARSAA
jgi:glycosyltransferase involved in cell wall biosynthesis